MKLCDRIMKLRRSGLSTREIADECRCLTAYVRVVTNQRKGRGMSETDRRYINSGGREKRNATFTQKYRTDPEFRAYHLAKSAGRWRKRKQGAHGQATGD